MAPTFDADSLAAARALASVREIDWAPAARRVAVPLGRNGGSGGETVFLLGADPSEPLLTVTLEPPRGSNEAPYRLAQFESRLERAGAVEIGPDGRRGVFFVTTNGGTGLHTTDLHLLDPERRALLTLSLTFAHSATQPIPLVERSHHFDRPELAAEQAFLETVKHAFGYTDSLRLERRADDPRLMFYFWERDHRGVTDGPLQVRRYTGALPPMSSRLEVLQDGPWSFIGLFKSGVVAYDSTASVFFPVFHPENVYAWPTALRMVGGQLVIGTRGEGLAVVDLERRRLRRIRFGEREDDDVRSLEVVGDRVVVNGRREVRLALVDR